MWSPLTRGLQAQRPHDRKYINMVFLFILTLNRIVLVSEGQTLADYLVLSTGTLSMVLGLLRGTRTTRNNIFI